jgi:hypothetical protein
LTSTCGQRLEPKVTDDEPIVFHSPCKGWGFFIFGPNPLLPVVAFGISLSECQNNLRDVGIFRRNKSGRVCLALRSGPHRAAPNYQLRKELVLDTSGRVRRGTIEHPENARFWKYS